MEGLIAVLAHSMRNTVAVIAGTAKHLEHRWDVLGGDDRSAALASLVDQADHLAAGLDALPALVATRLGTHCWVIAENAGRVSHDRSGDRGARLESLQAIERQCRQIDAALTQMMRAIPQPVIDELNRLEAARAIDGRGAAS